MESMAPFSAGDLQVLDQTDEVDIETQRSNGRDRRTIIWVVTSGGQAYIRSVRGPTGRWYQAVAQGGEARLVAGSHRWPIRTSAVTDQAEIEQVSQAISRKYQDRWPGPTAAMLRPEVLPTTLRIEPA